MLLSEFLLHVVDRFVGEHEERVGLDDVLEAIERLAEKGLMARTTTLESGVRIIRLSPEEFGKDELKVLEVVSRRAKPEITLNELMKETGWPPARARAALKGLEKARIARFIPGSYAEEDKWYFPGLEKEGF